MIVVVVVTVITMGGGGGGGGTLAVVTAEYVCIQAPRGHRAFCMSLDSGASRFDMKGSPR